MTSIYIRSLPGFGKLSERRCYCRKEHGSIILLTEIRSLHWDYVFSGLLGAVTHIGAELPVNFETLLLPQVKYSETNPSGVTENDEIRCNYDTDFCLRSPLAAIFTFVRDLNSSA